MRTLYLIILLFAGNSTLFAQKGWEVVYRNIETRDSTYLLELGKTVPTSEYAKMLVHYFKRSNQHAFVNRALESLKGSDSVLVNVQIQSMWVDFYLDNFPALLTKTEKLLGSELSPVQKAWVLYFRGQGENETGNYDSAYKSYLASFQVFEKERYSAGLVYALTGLGDIQRNLGDKAKSLQHYTRGLQLAREVKEGEVNALLLLGMAHSDLGEYAQALAYYEEALEGTKNDLFSRARTLNNIGNVSLRNKELEKALEANRASLELCMTHGLVYGAVVNYMNLAKIYNQKKAYRDAIQVIDAGFAYLKGRNFPAEEAELYRNYAEAYEGIGDVSKAYSNYKQYFNLREKLLSERTTRVVKELQLKYESEVKDKELEKIQYDLRLKESQNWFLILAVLLLLSIGGFIVYILLYRNRQLRLLYNQNIENLYRPATPVKSADKGDALFLLYEKILDALEKEEIFKKPTLSLTELSEMLNSNEKYVSNAISKYAGTNYSNFINRYRVMEAKRLMFENPGMNVNLVMVQCGFNSRTSFYTSFTKFAGISPSQFKEMSTKYDGTN